MRTIEDKYQKLKSILEEMGEVVVAYSGGVDSAFLLKVAVDTLGKKATGILAVSPTYPSREYEKAKDVARLIGTTLRVISTHEMDDESFVSNPVNRCYFCKKELFTEIAAVVKKENIKQMVDGSNKDDMGDHRPGMKALKELGVRSPLQEADLTKNDIRTLSKSLQIPTWDKDAMACLSSRFPYGEEITTEKLRMVDAAENALSDLGFRGIRARHQKNTIKIEVEPHMLQRFFENSTRQAVVTSLKAIGYTYVTVDLEGYRRGSLNESVSKEALQTGQWKPVV